MHRIVLLTALLGLPALATAQPGEPLSFADALAAERAETDAEFRDPAETPLGPRARAVFEGLAYFEADPAYAVPATLTRTPNAEPFEMATSTGATASYVTCGVLRFTLNGTDHTLHAYRSAEDPRDSLFVPFKDATNGTETYGGGRFLDVPIPSGEALTLDFNRAYNPYCAFSALYTCPLPPRENGLDARIAAGEKAPPAALAEAEAAPFPDEWVRMEEDGYAVSFPFEPERETESIPSPAGPLQSRMLAMSLGEGALIAGATRLPAALTEAVEPAVLLDGAANGMAGATGTTPDTLVPITLDGSPGRALSMSYGAHKAYWKVILRDGVLYQFGVVGPVERSVRERFFEGVTFVTGE